MRFVVVLEGQSQVMCGSIGIGLGHEGNIIALHGLDEALGHAVALRAAHGRGQWMQADLGGERTRFYAM